VCQFCRSDETVLSNTCKVLVYGGWQPLDLKIDCPDWGKARVMPKGLAFFLILVILLLLLPAGIGIQTPISGKNGNNWLGSPANHFPHFFS
jgi:hypothetical protein